MSFSSFQKLSIPSEPQGSTNQMTEQNRAELFLNDCLALGSLRGFEYFDVYSRGKEEVVVKIYANAKGEPFSHLHKSRSITPISENDEAVFLIAYYSKYKFPGVWIRSNHPKLQELKAKHSGDLPLTLNTTNSWNTRNVRVWEIVEELMKLILDPFPENPFQINLDKITSLSPIEQALTSGPLILFLKKIYLKNPPYYFEIFQDISKLCDIHFSNIQYINQ